MTPIRVGLMGLGRIGRNLFRILYDSPDIQIAAISDIADHASLEYLLRFDTLLGRFPDEVRIADGHLYVVGKQIPILAGAGPSDVNWGDLGVDIRRRGHRPASYATRTSRPRATSKPVPVVSFFAHRRPTRRT